MALRDFFVRISNTYKTNKKSSTIAELDFLKRNVISGY